MNIGASYAWTGGPGFAHSAAAKAGVKNLTESLAAGWGASGIPVNGLGPGPFPPGTPWNVMHMLLGYIAAVNGGDQVRDEYLKPTGIVQPADQIKE